MAQTKAQQAAAAKKADEAAAAQEEVAEEPTPKVATWREVEFKLPDQLPSTVLFDLTELEASADPMPVFRLLRSVLGSEQFVLVRNTIAEDDDIGIVADELLDAIFSQYGINLGE